VLVPLIRKTLVAQPANAAKFMHQLLGESLTGKQEPDVRLFNENAQLKKEVRNGGAGRDSQDSPAAACGHADLRACVLVRVHTGCLYLRARPIACRRAHCREHTLSSVTRSGRASSPGTS
jgi:hypothetical protein